MSQNRDKENYRKWKRAYYLKNREKELERKRKYRSTPKGKIATRKSWENAWKNSKHKILARKQVQKAILRGKLIRKPCVKCGVKKSDAHHPDYSKPLEVIWLCETHHYELHRGSRKKDEGSYEW